MSDPKKILTPLDVDTVRRLYAGDEVLISGIVLTARDQAHKRLCDCIRNAMPLPVDVAGSVIYYVGPTPPAPGRAIGAAGPTTSSRMDPFAPLLFSAGVKATIGKGCRSRTVREALMQCGGVHFAALGGGGALLSKHITACRLAAYEDLGPEAIYQLEFREFPVVVAYDSYGYSVYGETNIINGELV